MPLPAEPEFSRPGFLRVNSRNCANVEACTFCGFTTMTCGTLDTRPTGMKSLSML